MEEQAGDNEKERISRRKLIKRAGLGAAAVWAVPTISAAGPAHAQLPGLPGGDLQRQFPICLECAAVKQNPCSGQTACSPEFCTCLAEETAGVCFCHQPVSCAGQQPCQSSHDCPPGTLCAKSCCTLFGFPPLCIPICTAGLPAREAIDQVLELARQGVPTTITGLGSPRV